MTRPPRSSTLFPSPPLSRSVGEVDPPQQNRAAIERFLASLAASRVAGEYGGVTERVLVLHRQTLRIGDRGASAGQRSEEHTSELQSQSNLVCRLLLEKKKAI